MATCMTRSRPVHEPSVALLQTDLTDGSTNVGDTPDPQSPNPHTPTPLECLDPLLSLLPNQLSGRKHILALANGVDARENGPLGGIHTVSCTSGTTCAAP